VGQGAGGVGGRVEYERPHAERASAQPLVPDAAGRPGSSEITLNFTDRLPTSMATIHRAPGLGANGTRRSPGTGARKSVAAEYLASERKPRLLPATRARRRAARGGWMDSAVAATSVGVASPQEHCHELLALRNLHNAHDATRDLSTVPALSGSFDGVFE